MKTTILEIEKQRIFDNMSYREIGEKLGVTKQYLSFICNKKKNSPEIIQRKLLIEFDKIKDIYELNNQIRIKRKLLKITQAQIAKQVGTFASVVTRIENGDLKHSVFIKRIADYLEV
jgi:transcriptional regulator with XRE-family HTH domain